MEWKQIKGYEGIYEVSNTGLVKALPRTWKTGKNLIRTKEEHILKNMIRREGYYFVTVTKDSKQVQAYVHRFVAEAFLPNIFSKKCINHKDGNKLNNKVDNLEWATYRENNMHALNSGLRVNPSGAKNGYSKKITVDGITYGCIREYGEKSGLTKHQAYYKARKINAGLIARQNS